MIEMASSQTPQHNGLYDIGKNSQLSRLADHAKVDNIYKRAPLRNRPHTNASFSGCVMSEPFTFSTAQPHLDSRLGGAMIISFLTGRVNLSVLRLTICSSLVF